MAHFNQQGASFLITNQTPAHPPQKKRPVCPNKLVLPYKLNIHDKNSTALEYGNEIYFRRK